jgi:tape measure domain-containing protein
MADNATRLKIQASVEGIQGFDNLKRSLQGLAQQGQQSGRSLDRLYTATQQLAGASKNSVSSLRMQVQALTQLRDAAEIGSRRYRILGQDIERVNQQLRQASAAQPGGGGGAGGGLIGGLAARFAAPLAAGAGLAAATGAGVDAEAQQVRLKALTDQYGEYTQAQAAAATVAQTLRLSTAEAQGQFASLYASLRPTGITVRELEDALIGFGAAARNSGASAQETSAAMMQLKQALASGALQGEELRSIREQAPLVAQAIAKEMGVSIGALKDLAAEGKVTTDIVLRALTKLRDTQLGKLNQQFNTAQQAVADLGNAFKDASAELFKLFGPTVVAGLKGLTALLQGSANALKLNNKEAEISQKARLQAAQDVQKRFPGIEGATALTPRARAFFDERTQQIAARLRAETLQAPGPTAGQLGYQQSAEQERLNAAVAAGKGKEKKEKASLGAQIAKELQQALGLSEAQASGIVGNLIRESGLNPRINEGGAVGLPRNMGGYGLAQWTGTRQTDLIRFAGGASRAGDLATQLRFMVSELMGPESRAFSRLKQAQTPEQAAEIFDRFYERSGIRAIPERQANARRVFSELTNGSPVAGIGDYGRMLEKAQELAKQRQKDQQDYSTQLREDQASTKATTEELQLQRDLRTAATESDKIRAQYALDYFNTYQSLTKEVEGMVDPMSILQRIQAVDNDMAERYKEGLKEIAAIENERAMQLGSQQWQDQQVTLAATLSDYYSQQSEKLQEQNELAGSLAQTIGQGMQQAFSLAIQGAENLGQSLQELGATVLKDIAQQLIQIAVIAPVVSGIKNLISPPSPGAGLAGLFGGPSISPGINALPGGDFSSFFTGAGAASISTALPTAGITPFQGGNPFGFATGGIMTPQGPVPLRTYARGGIATAPQAAIYGEGSTPEAFIPLPDGRRVPVALKQYPGIPGATSAAQFESTDQVVQRLVETARQESTARAAAVAGSSPDGTVRIKVETTRINSVDYVSVEQAEALAQAAATRSTARQQRALQSSPGARRSLGI